MTEFENLDIRGVKNEFEADYSCWFRNMDKNSKEAYNDLHKKFSL